MAQTTSRDDAHGDHAPSAATVLARTRFVIQRPLWIFWLLFAINTLNYLDRLIAVAVGPALKAAFHLSNGDVGALSSAFLLVYTLAALPAGALADRLNARARVIAVGVAVWSVCSGLTAFVSGYGGLFATRAIVGVGEASYSPASVALLVNYYPRERRAGIIGRWQAGQILGTLLAFIVAGLLFAWLPAHLAWRAAFLLTAAPGLALAALARRMADHPALLPGAATDGAVEGAASELVDGTAAPRRSLSTEARALAAQTTQTLRIPMLWLVVALQALAFIVITPAVTFLPIYVQSASGPFHLSAARASFALGLTLVAGGFFGAILGGALSDWLNRVVPGGRVLAITIGFLAAIPPYVVMLLTTSLPVFLLASALVTLTVNLPSAALTATSQDVAPLRVRATAIAMTVLLSHLLGDIWAAWAVGRLSLTLHDHLALALLIVGAPALALGCALSLFTARVYARGHAAMA